MAVERLVSKIEETLMRLCETIVPFQKLPGFATGTALLLGVCSVFFFYGTKNAMTH